MCPRSREAATTCIYGHILRSLSNFSRFLDEKVGALSSPKKAQKNIKFKEKLLWKILSQKLYVALRVGQKWRLRCIT
jgi:hypothetical protein